MKILHCLESLDPAAGGPARSVPQLALAQARLGHKVGLWTADSEAGLGRDRRARRKDLADLGGDERDLLETPAGSFAEALEEFGRPDVVHDHGIWLPFHREIARECARLKIPRIVSPRGMLEPWALNHKKWKKKLAWWLYQKRDLQNAVAFHATADSEAEQLRRLGSKQAIIVAANGVTVDRTSNTERPTSDIENQVGRDGLGAPISSTIHHPIRTALFLSRIHPKKGLPMLLEAWARLRPEGWQLQVVGPDEGGHVAELKRLCEKLGLAWEDAEGRKVESRKVESRKPEECAVPLAARVSPASVCFSGPFEGDEKWAAFRAAELFILPTHSENFGIAVAEALACGVPVITTHGAPWKLLESERCGWWVPVSVDGIATALDDAMRRSPAELAEMGERGTAVVAERFSWDKIAGEMIACYEWVLGRGPKPRSVFL